MNVSPHKKILLVNPWIHDFAAYDFWSKPVGLLSIASLLRNNNYTIDLIDCLDPYASPDLNNLPKRKATGAGKFFKESIPKPEQVAFFPRRYNRYGISPDIFKRRLQNISTPSLIFVTSMMTYWYGGVFETIRLLKEAWPSIPVFLGGNYASLCTEHAMAYSDADVVLSGEAETMISDILEDYSGNSLEFVPARDDLDSYPYPAYDLLNRIDQVAIMTSRGCPYRCSYCASSYLNRGFRMRDPIKVVDEIEYWHRNHGVRNFSFYDDALLVNARNHAVPMMKEIIARDLPIQFHCPNGLHIREIDGEVSALMKRSGFKTVRFGFETADATRQESTGGKITNEETREAIGCLLRAGYAKEEIGVYILCGLPGQTADEVRESIVFIRACGARPVLAEFSPIPKTAIWEEAVRCSPYPIAEEPLFQNNTLLPCRWKGLTYEDYLELKRLTREV